MFLKMKRKSKTLFFSSIHSFTTHAHNEIFSGFKEVAPRAIFWKGQKRLLDARKMESLPIGPHLILQADSLRGIANFQVCSLTYILKMSKTVPGQQMERLPIVPRKAFARRLLSGETFSRFQKSCSSRNILKVSKMAPRQPWNRMAVKWTPFPIGFCG